MTINIRLVAFFILAFIGALWLGMSIVTRQDVTILYVAGGALFLFCAYLGRRIWLLLIFFIALNVPVMRGFGTAELGQGLFIGFTVMITMMRRQEFKISFGEKEVWMVLIMLCVLQVYIRNPVGMSVFGASNVGGRPYFVVSLAFVCFMILGNIQVKPSEMRWLLPLTIIGSIAGVAVGIIRGSGTGAPQQMEVTRDEKAAGRILYLGDLGKTIARAVGSFISPLRALFSPFWAVLILCSFAAAVASGFRSNLAGVGLICLVAMAYRGGFISVFVSTIVGIVILALLAFINVVTPLPPNMQRALSPFPGTWEERYIADAEGSTQWRLEMWEEALFTDYWIENKILGDGLGFTRRELLMMDELAGSAGLSSGQETFMVSGGYHSGPVQTVRTVGYVGLAILLLAMIRIAVHAHRQIVRCRDTEWYPLSLFIGIPAIVLPIFFTLIFGDFGNDTAALFLSYALISLLEKNLPLPPYEKRGYRPIILSQNRDSTQRGRTP